MGSWLFSSNPCNCSSCELGTHPGAHRLVYVRRPSELNAFRNAVKTEESHSARQFPPPPLRPPIRHPPTPPANRTPILLKAGLVSFSREVRVGGLAEAVADTGAVPGICRLPAGGT